jgi:hypothetical protein
MKSRVTLLSLEILILLSWCTPSASQADGPSLDSGLTSIRVVSVRPETLVRYIPILFRLRDASGDSSSTLICTVVGSDDVLISGDLIPSPDKGEVVTLTQRVDARFRGATRVEMVRPSRREADLTVDGERLDLGEISSGPLAPIVLGETVHKKGLSVSPIKITIRMFWTEEVSFRKVIYRVDWEAIKRELAVRTQQGGKISIEELETVATQALHQAWVRPAEAADSTGKADDEFSLLIRDTVVTITAKALLSPVYQRGSHTSHETTQSTYYSLNKSVDVAHLSSPIDLSELQEVGRSSTVKEDLPPCKL